MRRLSDGESREMESGPKVGAQRVGECIAEPGLDCISSSGSRRMNKRRNPCLSPSLYRPDEIPYVRPAWRYDLDLWISPYGTQFPSNPLQFNHFRQNMLILTKSDLRNYLWISSLVMDRNLLNILSHTGAHIAYWRWGWQLVLAKTWGRVYWGLQVTWVNGWRACSIGGFKTQRKKMHLLTGWSSWTDHICMHPHCELLCGTHSLGRN